MQATTGDGVGMSGATVPFRVSPYTGQIDYRFAEPDFLDRLARLPDQWASPDAVLHDGTNRVVLVSSQCRGEPIRMAVKSYGAGSFLAERGIKRTGSRARRSWLGACLLRSYGIGTPEPIAFLERWDGSRLKEAYYVSLFEPAAVPLSRELERLSGQLDGEEAQQLMAATARAIATLHRARLLHGHLADSNVLLCSRPGQAYPGAIQFTGLHHVAKKHTLHLRDQARDVGVLRLPAGCWKRFTRTYFGDRVPAEFESLLSRTRGHKKSTLLIEGVSGQDAEEEPSIWEPNDAGAGGWADSGQEGGLNPPPRNSGARRRTEDQIRLQDRYKDAYVRCFRDPVPMVGRIGIGIEPDPDTLEQALEWLSALGNAPVIVRVHYGRGEVHWEHVVQLAERLSSMGRAVGLSLIQDRQAVLSPRSWDRFVTRVLDYLHADVDWVELGHAVDDPAWGIARPEEYQRLMRLLPWLRQQYPSVRFMGPATSRWDLEGAEALARQVPETACFRAWSTHLNLRPDVPPESVDDEMGLDLLERCAWVRALAAHSRACDDRVIVSGATYSLRRMGPLRRPGRFSQAGADVPGLSESAYAQYMIRYLLIALCSGLVERVYWWRLVAARCGLIDDAQSERWRARPAFRMLAFFLHAVGRSTYMTRRVDEDRRYYLFRTPDREALVLAYTTLPERKTTIAFPAQGVFNAFGEPQPLVQDACMLTGAPLYFAGVQDIRWFFPTKEMACQQRA